MTLKYPVPHQKKIISSGSVRRGTSTEKPPYLIKFSLMVFSASYFVEYLHCPAVAPFRILSSNHHPLDFLTLPMLLRGSGHTVEYP